MKYWRWSKGWFFRIGVYDPTLLSCGKCGSTALRKNGHSKGKAKYLCTACHHQAVFQPAAPVRAARYAQVEQLLLERVSQRAIVRLTGVARMRVAKLAKKARTARPTPGCLRPHRVKELELDQMWTFVGRKKRKVWRWLAGERYWRRIVAWVLGSRGRATARCLWQALPDAYRTRTWYHTDEWEASRGVFPRRAHQAHPKGSGQTSLVEAINCCLRQRCAVLVRKSCCFTRSLAMPRVRIQRVIDEHNRQCTTN